MRWELWPAAVIISDLFLEQLTDLDIDFERLVAMSERNLKSRNGFMALSADQKGVVIPVDLRAVRRKEVVLRDLPFCLRRTEWLQKAGDKGAAYFLDLSSALCRDCDGAHDDREDEVST